jgi:hypothetical protein
MIESTPPAVPSARRLRARTAAVAGLVTLLLGSFGAPAAAAASVALASSTPTPTPSPTVEPGEAVFTLSPLSSGILEPGGRLTVSVTMTNETFGATPGGTVSLALGAAPMQNRAVLDAWLAGDTAAAAVTEVATSPFPVVEAGGEQTAGIMVAEDDPIAADLAPGVHPLVATLTTTAGTFTSTSVVVVPGQSVRQTGIGVVVPITADATASGLLTADELAELTGPDGSLTSQLDAVDGTQAILAVDPALPAAIRVLGSSAPESAVLWLARLEALSNTRFALQFGDADVAAQVQAGIVPPLRPTSLQYAMQPADFTPPEDATPTPAPTATADPTAPVYPDLPTLLDIGSARAGVFWPATGTAGSDVVAELGDVTVGDQRGLTLIPSRTTVAGAAGGTVAARGDAGEAAALVYDSAVSRELETASTLDEGSLRGAHLAAATAYLAFALGETGGAPLLVTVDRAQDRSRVALRTAITTALEAPGAVPSSLGALANAAPEPIEVAGVEPDSARVAAASALVSDEEQLTQFASVLDDPAQLTGPERTSILQLLGDAWRGDPGAWSVALAAHRTASTATLASVEILRASPIQLITSGAVIPVWIRNDLPYPVNVTLLASPDDLRLEVQETTRVVAQPQSNTRVEVPVQAQIGSGDVTIALELRSPTGVPIGQPEVREVHVRADWEGIGLVVLTALAVGFVLLGVIRTIMRRRGGKTDAEPGADTDAAATGSPDAATTPDTDAEVGSPDAEGGSTDDAETPSAADPGEPGR